MKRGRYLSSVFTFILVLVTVPSFVLGFAGFPLAKADLSASNGESWAIIVGVSDYLYSNGITLKDLNYCDDNAQNLYNQIAPTWGANHIKLLIDAEANKTVIQDAIFNWLAPAENAGDTVLFFFSGHGGQGSSDVAPIDEADGKDEYICPHDSLTSSWANDIRDDELDTWLSILDSGKIVIVLDTCFSGGFISSMGATKFETDRTEATEADTKIGGPNDGFALDISKSGRAILTACAENEESWEVGILQHGVFSYYIIEALSKLDTVDANANHEISAEEIFDYAEPRTISFTAENCDATQHPQLYDGYSGDLPLIMAATITFDNSPRATLITIDGKTYSPSQLPKPFTWAKNTLHTFNVTSMAYEVLTENIALESAHPYLNNTDYTWPPLTHAGATSGRVHFDYIRTEERYDRVYILDGAGKVYANYSGNFDDLWSAWVPGSTIKIRLTSDYSKSYDGFIIDSLDWEGQTVRHEFNSWNDGNTSTSRTLAATDSQTLMAIYNTEYHLAINSPYGSKGGEGWYENGTTAHTNLTTGGTIDCLNGTQRIFTNWSGDASGTNCSASDPICMNSSKTATANWKTQYYITVNSGHGIPTASQWVDEGGTLTVSVSSPTEIIAGNRQWVCTGYSLDGGSLQPGTNFAFPNIQAPSLIAFNWKEQFYLTVNSAHGSPGGYGWYDSGSPANALLSAGTVSGGTGIQYVFIGWGGDALGTGLTSNIITMSSAKTATANWKTQYYLNVSSTYGIANGTGWYDKDAYANANVSSTVPGPTGTQYVFTSWSGAASGNTSTSNPILMNNPKNAQANWKTQYKVSFATNPGGGGTVLPSSDTWFDQGASPISISASASVGYSFSSWSATTGINIADTQSSGTTATITAPGTITANFAVPIPEFDLPSLILPLFIATTLLVSLECKRKNRKTTFNI